MGDVCDVHAQLEGAIGQGLDVQGVINVLAPRRIHAADGQMAQVFPARSALLSALGG